MTGLFGSLMMTGLFGSLMMTGLFGSLMMTGLSVLHRFSGEQHLRSPLLSQIFPPRIFRFDQSNLSAPQPAF
jgi:hypothetical protein